jgi:tryptophan synthase beta chain
MSTMEKKLYPAVPDARGHFGVFGGRYIPETLLPASEELAAVYDSVKEDEAFNTEFRYYLKYFVGRETPLFFAERLTAGAGGAKIYLKREDLWADSDCAENGEEKNHR